MRSYQCGELGDVSVDSEEWANALSIACSGGLTNVQGSVSSTINDEEALKMADLSRKLGSNQVLTKIGSSDPKVRR